MIEKRLQLPQKWVNPVVLKWARLQVGLQLKDIEALSEARKAKIAAERIIAWESRSEKPVLAELEVLAELYDCPVGYFFLDSLPDVRPPLDFRGLDTEKKVDSLRYETRLRLREFDRLTEGATYFIERLELPWEVRIGLASLEEPVELVAKRERERLGFKPEIRQQWTSAAQAFSFWRTAIESLGVLVIALKLDPQEARGASKWISPGPPAILVNHSDIEAATGRTFTLLHELAHLLVKRPGLVCDSRGQEHKLERFANMFAAEMVLPRKELKEFLRSKDLLKKHEWWGDELLDRIRAPFKVSRNVVAIHLEEIGLAPPEFYYKKRAMWDKRRPYFGGGTRAISRLTKAEYKLGEVGLAMARIIASAYERGVMSKLDLADIFDMRVEQAERFVAWVREKAERPVLS